MSWIEKIKLKKMMDREKLNEWAKDKPLSILQLDPADRAVLKIAGKIQVFSFLIKFICRRNSYRIVFSPKLKCQCALLFLAKIHMTY